MLLDKSYKTASGNLDFRVLVLARLPLQRARYKTASGNLAQPFRLLTAFAATFPEGQARSQA